MYLHGLPFDYLIVASYALAGAVFNNSMPSRFWRRRIFWGHFAVKVRRFDRRAAQRWRGRDVEYKFISGFFARVENM